MKVDRVKPKTLKKILKDFTLEELAKAKPEDLTEYEGVGKTIAWRIIVAARKEIKTETAKKPAKIDEQWLSPPPPVPGIFYSPPVGPPAVGSVRVQRIREGMEG